MNSSLINHTIYLRPGRLDVQLPRITVRRLHSFCGYLINIPTDVTGVYIRIFKTDNQAHFDIPISRRPDGSTGLAYIPPTCFPELGTATYEIHALDFKGNATALGIGVVEILPFSLSSTPITPGEPVQVDQVADSTGALHTLSAVPDGQGNYTIILDA